MKLVVTAQSQNLPEDVYAVKLLSVEEQDGAYGKQLVWQLQVAEGEYAGTTLKAWSNSTSALNSKTIKWASAFAGRPLRAGEEIDLRALVGNHARAVVSQRQAQNGNTYARVTDILPARRAQVQAQAKAGVLAEDEYDPDDPFAQDWAEPA